MRSAADPVGQATQVTRLGQPAAIKSGVRAVEHFVGIGLGGRQAHQRHERGFVGRGILARGLAQGLGVGRHIQDVIDDLERQPDAGTEIGQAGRLVRIGIGCGGRIITLA